MSETNKREILLPEVVTGIMNKQIETIESLVKLNRLTLDVLSQYINVEGYERMMSEILDGDDAIIE